MTRLEKMKKSQGELIEYMEELLKSLPDPEVEKVLNAMIDALWAMEMAIAFGKIWEDKG